MRELNIEEIRSIQLEMLDSIHEFCVKNNIRYSICGGTLLGAVRHKGFIPWDDDIDIMMPRPDFDRFTKEYKDENSPELECIPTISGYCKVHNKKTTCVEPWGYKYTKTRYGLFIDVFPIDGLPQNNLIAKLLFSCIALIRSICVNRNFIIPPSNTLLQKICFLGVQRLPQSLISNLHKLYNKLLLIVPFDNAKRVVSFTGIYGLKDSFDKRLFDVYGEILFESKYYHCIKNFDSYLKILYGDYMKLPPETQRHHHNIKAYITANEQERLLIESTYSNRSI